MINLEVSNFYQWRDAARELLRREIAPERLNWNNLSSNQSSFNFGETIDYRSMPTKFNELKIPKGFFDLAENAACFRDDRRWGLLYSVAWRILFEQPRLLGNSIDTQIADLLKMQKAVSRDKHKMKAFVRFKQLDIKDSDLSYSKLQRSEHLIAWFEPEHLIVREIAPFFIKRFTNMSWSILTPDLCAHWDGKEASFSQGIEHRVHAQDDLEDLWLEYYKNIFNPARLKIKAMQSEMPKKYWANLPEAVLIDELTRNAESRTRGMIQQSYSAPTNKISESTYVKDQQNRLRRKTS